jgi:hypothetical protein
MMSDNFKSRLTPENPLPQNRTAADVCPLDEEGVEMAQCGYSVLSRANPKSYFNRHQGPDLAPPVYLDGPQPDND